MKKYLYLMLILLIGWSCIKAKTENEITYEKVLSHIRIKSIKKHELNWNYIEMRVKDSIKTFQSREDLERAIQFTLVFINDGHSFFIGSKVNNPFLSKTLALPEVEAKIVGKNIGYLKIPGFGANDSISKLYSLKIRSALMNLDQSGELSGWIIDVRGNFGGHAQMFSMGLAPLLQDSIIGYSINNRGKMVADKYVNGYYFIGNKKIDSIAHCNSFLNKDKKIAVLIDNHTASCGEMITITLKQRKTTRTFGLRTRGALSSLRPLVIENKEQKYLAQLYLAEESWCDGDKNIINGKLTPDVQCKWEECLDSAIQWIEKDSTLAKTNGSAIQAVIN